jgi:L-ascorbate metabolism protein UlaG (beta-lactamase superfamily)
MTITVRWFPQSFVQTLTGESTAYIDPGMPPSLPGMLKGLLLPGSEPKPEGLSQGDLIMVTHPHSDHLSRSMIDRLSGASTKVLGSESCRRKLGATMTAVGPGSSLKMRDIAVEVVHAYNPEGSRAMTYHPKGFGVGYVLTVEGKRIYHAGDTGLIQEMRDMAPVDLALLPIGGRFTMNVDEAAEAIKLLKPSVVVPMHRLKADPLALVEKVKDEDTEVKVLAPGEALVLEDGGERSSR